MAIWLAENWLFFLVWWIILIHVGLLFGLLAKATADSCESGVAAVLIALTAIGCLGGSIVFKLLFIASLIVNNVLLAKS